jgi:glycosyltransferase involved in cell wall biosynthesis
MKKNIKIGVISEAPIRTTGFGQTCKHIVNGLRGVDFEVVCFGIGVFGETFDRSEVDCKIWAVGNSNLTSPLQYFLSYEQPDILFINYNITSVQRWYALCRELGWQGPVIGHFVLDGLPFDPRYLKVISLLNKKITATHSVANYLHSLGYQDIRVAPHGVDKTLFKPLSNRTELRVQAGVEDKFVVGIFGRNVERKQQPRILFALARLKELGMLEDIIVYFHCQSRDNPGFRGWDLKRLASDLAVSEHIFFPHKDFKQISGVPTRSETVNVTYHTDSPSFPQSYGYVERINCCDVIINTPFCGGFELTIIESQACGIPVVNTDDKGIMREVIGNGGILLPAFDVGVWHTGAYQYFVSPKEIADCILELKRDSNLRQELSILGTQNSRNFSWSLLEDAAVEAVKEIIQPCIYREKLGR